MYTPTSTEESVGVMGAVAGALVFAYPYMLANRFNREENGIAVDEIESLDPTEKDVERVQNYLLTEYAGER